MKNMFTLAAILLAIWAGSAAAQSAVGGPKKPSNLGGPTVQQNPVVPAPKASAPTPPPPSPPKPKK
ncbi:hypothetical protein [Bradyrhizobium sp. CER78]|uniref:hypothetical protein n=1 Tax=Bradyrhizobium sp. CER78 TaxID=3039162 RepID=UPI0024499086|nr:hypothetical protein [Bradyrhizobium sp. CER78]MDH2386504.1 hypothetical protein [Bradyrhizobium sp. CER78]